METYNFINRKFYKLSKTIVNYDKSDIQYDFGVGQSPFGVINILAEKLKEVYNKDEYLLNSVLPKLKKEISNYYSEKLGYLVKDEQIIIGPGSKQLIYMLFMVLEAKIYLPIPCCPSYLEHIKILNKKMTPLNTRFLDNWKMDKSMLEKTILKTKEDKLKLLVFNNPNNPTGILYENHEVKFLSSLLKSDNTLILCDEIYEGLIFNQESFTSMAKYLPEQSIIVSSLSKAIGAGGWRLGYMILPNRLRELKNTITYITNQIYLNVSTPIQYAALGLFSNKNLLHNEFSKISHILEILSDIIFKIIRKTKLRCVKPAATWYLFIDFSNYIEELNLLNIRNGKQLEIYLYENNKINCFPGEYFGMNNGIIAIRLSLVDFDGRKLLKNYTKNIDDNWIINNCPKVIDGVNLIVNFVKGFKNLK